jgi:hypothetical protein
VTGSTNFEIGIALVPDHHGHGVGTQAQRQLVSYLFDTTTANRLQAGTELDNVAEQRSLELVGFRRECIQRGLYFRAGAWRHSIMYGLLQADWLSRATEERPSASGSSSPPAWAPMTRASSKCRWVALTLRAPERLEPVTEPGRGVGLRGSSK